MEPERVDLVVYRNASHNKYECSIPTTTPLDQQSLSSPTVRHLLTKGIPMSTPDYDIKTFPTVDTAAELSANHGCVIIDDTANTVHAARAIPKIDESTFAEMTIEDKFATMFHSYAAVLEELDASKRREAQRQREIQELADTVEYRKSAVSITKRILTTVALRKAQSDDDVPALVPRGAKANFLEKSTNLTAGTRQYFRRARDAETPLERGFTHAAHQVAVRTAAFHINGIQNYEEREAYSDLLRYATGLVPFEAERIGTGVLSDM